METLYTILLSFIFALPVGFVAGSLYACSTNNERIRQLEYDKKIYLARAEASEADYARVVERNRELENEVETAEIVLEHHLYNFPKAPTEFDCLGAMIAELVKQFEAERVPTECAHSFHYFGSQEKRRCVKCNDIEAAPPQEKSNGH